MSQTKTLKPRATRVGLALWGTESVGATVNHAKLAEQVGFESIWLTDTQLICRELYVTLAACATATTRLMLATGVTVPRTRHPSVTASALATLNELSNGRAMAGISVGHSALRNIGQTPVPIAELADYVNTVRQLLDGQAVEFGSGTDGALTWAQHPVAVPLHIAATGPRLTRAAAGMADGVILLQGSAPDLIDKAMDLVEQGLVEAGRAPGSIQTTAWVYVGLDNDRQRAHDQVRARVAAVLRMMDPLRFEGQDREAVERLRHGYDMFAHAESSPAHAALVPEHLISRYAVAGTPDEVHARINGLLADPRIDRVVVSPQIGAPGQTITQDFITQFGAAVLARL
ncbi:MAG: LLM class flavin-dependent oxidoreductase [Rhodospirillaceae bacterium]|nr:LLM class flavin-dependent oxidoreductase [Rhodospirillaceae bacterium]MBT4489334.1 LLM class flavin-dependent oxidoreductase [Rhodospirillaceae bacterium]MBT6426974.1 LLM class flavin-dependent oxidoreductase [Rhodospirillaceae bacterium]MBT7757958.1 LLM class flavin-dependent oxidoreductase [Rhodospirillaceae bacterium]